MKAIDIRDNILNEYLLDDERHISSERSKDVCLIRQGEKTCRYVMFCNNGFVCMKNTPVADMLDSFAKDNRIIAKSDNCGGIGAKKDKEKEKEKSCDTENK